MKKERRECKKVPPAPSGPESGGVLTEMIYKTISSILQEDVNMATYILFNFAGTGFVFTIRAMIQCVSFLLYRRDRLYISIPYLLRINVEIFTVSRQ